MLLLQSEHWTYDNTDWLDDQAFSIVYIKVFHLQHLNHRIEHDVVINYKQKSIAVVIKYNKDL